MSADLKTIPLGFKAKDRITGLTGIAIARIEWLNGCWRISIQPEQVKDGKPVEASSFDIQQIEVIEEKTENSSKPQEKPPGGPFPEPTRNADPI